MRKSVTVMSQEEFDALEASGAITVPAEKKAPTKLPEVPKAPVVADTGLTEVAEATKQVADSVKQVSTDQTEAVKTAMTQVSDALRVMAEKPTWQHIRIEVTRGRNDLIKTADLIKVS